MYLTNFEKYYFIKYLKQIEILDYNVRSIALNLARAVKFKPCVTIDCTKLLSHDDEAKLVKQVCEFVKSLHCNLKDCILSKKFNKIKDVYKLNTDEIEYLIFLYLISSCPNIKSLFNLIYSVSDAVYFRYIKTRTTNGRKLVDNLYRRGIVKLSYTAASENNLSDNIYAVLENNVKLQDVRNELVGDIATTSLSIDDFTYIEIDTLAKLLRTKNKLNILFYGNVGTGKTEFAKCISKHCNLKMYLVDTCDKSYKELDRQARLADYNNKQNILDNTSCILFDEADDVLYRGFSEVGKASKSYINNLLETNRVTTIWIINDIDCINESFLRRMNYCLEFKDLTEDQRLKIWNKTLNTNNSKITKLVKTYKINPSVISNAINMTEAINGNEDDFCNIIESCAKTFLPSNYKITKDSKLDNYNIQLVNADVDLDKLSEQIKSSNKLNFSMLLTGYPGTGKSLYAIHLADKLGIQYVSKKASDIIDSFVGQTEKNIANMFEQATNEKSMLIIDEIDSFLLSRQKAERNFEILQVNEFLTHLQDFQYPFIGTTNLVGNLDDAVFRRFIFKIKFDFMNRQQVKLALEQFFDITDDYFINGLTVGDFKVVKNKLEFLGNMDKDKVLNLLQEEVKIKRLNKTVGF